MKRAGGFFLRLALVACVGSASVACGQPWPSRPLVVPLDQAVRDRWVEAEVSGLGSAAGDVMLVTVRRLHATPLRLGLTPGTTFVNYAGDAQNMIGMVVKGKQTGETTYMRTGGQMYLDDDARHTYVIEGYCLDFYKNNPRRTDRFAMYPPSEREARIVQTGWKKSASQRAIQAAIWMAREYGVPVSALKQRFKITDDDLAKARAILAEANRPAPDFNVAVGGEVHADRPGVPLMVGQRILALLEHGTPMQVTESKGEWIGVAVTLDDQQRLGWVKKADVHPVNSIVP